MIAHSSHPGFDLHFPDGWQCSVCVCVCVCVCAHVLVAHSCPDICDPLDCSPPGSSVHGIFQARILEWVAIPFSRGSSQPRDWTQVSCMSGRFFTIWATRETQQCRASYFDVLVDHVHFLFEKCFFSYFANFSFMLFAFLMLSCINCLGILDITPYQSYHLQVNMLSFHFVNGYLLCAKSFKYN